MATGLVHRSTNAAASPDAAQGGARPATARGGRGGPSRKPPAASRQGLDIGDWPLIAPVFASGMMIILGMAETWPHPASLVMALLASAIAILSRHVGWFQRRLVFLSGAGAALTGFFVGWPMLLFGAAVAHSAHHGELADWSVAASVLVVTALISGFLTHRLLSATLTAQASLWLGVVLVVGATIHFSILAAGVLAAIHLLRRQLRREETAASQGRERDRAQSRAEMLLAEYEASSHGWFWETDRRGVVVYASPQIADLLGEADLAGTPFTDLFDLDSEGQEGERTLNFHLSARSSFHELAVRAATAEEEQRWWSISGQPIHDEFNNFLGFRGSGSDLTEQRRTQERASRLAHYDSLTELANRFQMSETLEKILSARREEQRACAVLLLDLDRFKQVNDTLGHPAGDALLRQVAQRLVRSVDEMGRVGRLGGDEFQVVIPGRVGRADLAALASRIIESLSHPYSIDGHRVVIGVSVGIAVAPDDGDVSEDIVRNADLALYAAKDGGRGRYHFYAEDLHTDAQERRQLEQDLRDAISNGDLQLFYQPVVETTTETIAGFEALLRWNHPVHGWMSPAKFIPVAEDAGLIAMIGEWALRTACAELSSWPETVRVAVNVSPLQFANPSLPAIVTSALASAQVDPGRLELEITESVFLNDDDSTDAMFKALKGVGVRLALDDFGTGYSSLGYLRKAPFNKIKIDQSFVRGATIAGSRNGAIIAAIVSLAESLDMETTAEGVETLDELDLVRALGCSHIQGYIYEKPLTSVAAAERLATGLNMIASGPKSARDERKTMLRKVILEHDGQPYEATIRNISRTGAMVEGLWNVPAGTVFRLHFARGNSVQAMSRWGKDDRMGIEFARPLALDDAGQLLLEARRTQSAASTGSILRKAG